MSTMEQAPYKGQEQNRNPHDSRNHEKPERYHRDLRRWRPDAEDLLALATPDPPGSTGVTKNHCPNSSEEEHPQTKRTPELNHLRVTVRGSAFRAGYCRTSRRRGRWARAFRQWCTAPNASD